MALNKTETNSTTNFTTTQSPTTTTTSLSEMCAISESSARQNMLQYFAQLAILGATLCLIAVLVVLYSKKRILLHGNLLLLLSNIIAVCFLNTFSNFVISFKYCLVFLFYADSCGFVSPLWMSAVFVGPIYIYSIAYPAFHFCVMVERVRATFLAEKYEGEGQKLGFWMTGIIWALSIGFMLFVILTAYANPELRSHPQPFMLLTSPANAQPIFYISLAILVLTICTALGDWRIYEMNRRIREKNCTKFQSYSLSRNYQLNENALTMRLILPLDVLYACFYLLYTIIAMVIRYFEEIVSSSDYIFYFCTANTFLYIYSAVTIIVYIRFLNFIGRCQKRDLVEPITRRPEEHAKIYFKQLQAQWQ